MPFGDGTGPRGLGPRTGRGAGYCAGYGAPGSVNPVFGGAGFGFGRGWSNRYYATGIPAWRREGFAYSRGPVFTAEDELSFLRNEAEFLRKRLEQVQNRISSMRGSEKRD